MARARVLPPPGVRVSVSRDAAIPLVNQIHDQVAAAIASGDLKPGDRLPTIRELAQFLKINRNTVSQAYRLLESSGHVRTRAGAGTIVSAGRTADRTRDDELRRLVTAALKQARDRGFTAQEFGSLAYYEAQRQARAPRVAVLVIHDYPEELAFLDEGLSSQFPEIDTTRILLQDLPDLGNRRTQLSEVDFAMVPVRMLSRVNEVLPSPAFPVLGVGIGPSLATLVRVAKETDAGANRIAVVCTEPAGAAMMEDVLRSAEVTAELRHVTVHDPGLRDVVAWADLVLVSDASAEAVSGLGTGRRVIRYATLINDSSLATVRGYVDHVVQLKASQLDPLT